MQKNPPKNSKRGEVRIIAGKCRGRKIYFPNTDDIRPTPNRIRETLFNWLAPYIRGASCLDLFAGSGALSFEAMSRGARYCLLLDSSKDAIHALNENRSLLGLSHIDIHQATFPYPESVFKENFDIVFLDPPFHQNYIPQALEWLIHSPYLNEGALIYIESETDNNVINLPNHWVLLKDKQAGHVRYSIAAKKTE